MNKVKCTFPINLEPHPPGGVSNSPRIGLRSSRRGGFFPRQKRAYDAAAMSMQTADWRPSYGSASAAILPQLERLIGLSRELAENNPYVAGFIKRVAVNMFPASALHEGMRFQNRAIGPNGDPDNNANNAIEKEWSKWCKRDNLTVMGSMSMADLCSVGMASVVRDGGFLLRIVRGREWPMGIAVQPLEIDHLDIQDNRDLGGGRRIIGGVELNAWGKPVAYKIFPSHPGDIYRTPSSSIRVPASDIRMIFRPLRFGSLHAPPWFAHSMVHARLLGKYVISEATAANIAAGKMGFFKESEGASYTGDDIAGPDDVEGYDPDEDELITQATPGTFERLPYGIDFQAFDPQHPNTAFDAFCKQILRGMAAGQCASYMNFAADLKEANFGSMRQGELTERDHWMQLQAWWINDVMSWLYDEWLKIQSIMGPLAAYASRIDDVSRPTWTGKRWGWVDPAKDMKAAEMRLKNNLTTYSDLMNESGAGDFDEVIARRQREETIIQEKLGGFAPTIQEAQNNG